MADSSLARRGGTAQKYVHPAARQSWSQLAVNVRVASAGIFLEVTSPPETESARGPEDVSSVQIQFGFALNLRATNAAGGILTTQTRPGLILVAPQGFDLQPERKQRKRTAPWLGQSSLSARTHAMNPSRFYE